MAKGDNQPVGTRITVGSSEGGTMVGLEDTLRDVSMALQGRNQAEAARLVAEGDLRRVFRDAGMSLDEIASATRALSETASYGRPVTFEEQTRRVAAAEAAREQAVREAQRRKLWRRPESRLDVLQMAARIARKILTAPFSGYLDNGDAFKDKVDF